MICAKKNWEIVSHKLFDFQQNNKFTDVDIIVDDKKFRAHKIILASACPYFETMFTSDLSEKNKSCIEVKGISQSVFEEVFNYIYKGSLKINTDNVQEIFQASSMLQLISLVNYCCDVLQQNICNENVVDIYRLVDMYSCNDSTVRLKLECKRFIEKNFLNLIKYDVFLDLPVHLLENLLKSESLNINNECEVLKLALRWILKNPEERKINVIQLMKQVRLPTIREDKKLNIINTIENQEIQDILKKIIAEDKDKELYVYKSNGIVLEKQFFIENNHVEQDIHNLNDKNLRKINQIDLRWQPRIQTTRMVYLIGGKSKNSIIYPYILRVNTLCLSDTRMVKTKVLRYNHQSVVLNGLVYIAGGNTLKNSVLREMEIYDPYENTTEISVPMIKKRTRFGLECMDGFLYAIGGTDELLVTIERFDPKESIWTLYDLIPNLPLYGFGVCKFNDGIYIIGGYLKNQGITNRAFCYYPKTKILTELEEMKFPRADFGIALLHNHIYVVGGINYETSLKSVERYSLLENKWSLISDMSQPRDNCCVTITNNKLIVIGDQQTGNVIYYDPENNKWHNYSKKPIFISKSSIVKL